MSKEKNQLIFFNNFFIFFMKVVSKLFKNCPLTTVLKTPINKTINTIIYKFFGGRADI